MISLIPLLVSLIGFFVLAEEDNVPTELQWQKIVLMRSTRDDVERLLGRPRYEGYYTSFKVEDGVLSIEYYPFDLCMSHDAYLKVPRWTVVEITYEPDNPPTLADLKLDLKKFRKTRESPHVPELITYINDVAGVAYTFQADGTLNDVRYFPAKRFDSLRCNKKNRSRRKT